MIRIDFIWLALGASDLRGGIDKLLAQVVRSSTRLAMMFPTVRAASWW